MGDKVILRGIGLRARHGAYAHERRRLRRFSVDVEAELDLRQAGNAERLDLTVDYDEVARIVVEIGTGRTFQLLEAFALALVEALGSRYPQAGFVVEVRKLSPPCVGRPALAAVRLGRQALGRRGSGRRRRK